MSSVSDRVNAEAVSGGGKSNKMLVRIRSKAAETSQKLRAKNSDVESWYGKCPSGMALAKSTACHQRTVSLGGRKRAAPAFSEAFNPDIDREHDQAPVGLRRERHGLSWSASPTTSANSLASMNQLRVASTSDAALKSLAADEDLQEVERPHQSGHDGRHRDGDSNPGRCAVEHCGDFVHDRPPSLDHGSP